MPLYEYTCKSCRKTFDKLVKSMDSKEKVVCPECGSTRTSRAISVFAAVGSDSKSDSTAVPPGMCGRCGGPGPCAME